MNKRDIERLERVYNCTHIPLWKITNSLPTGKLEYAEE